MIKFLTRLWLKLRYDIEHIWDVVKAWVMGRRPLQSTFNRTAAASMNHQVRQLLDHLTEHYPTSHDRIVFKDDCPCKIEALELLKKITLTKNGVPTSEMQRMLRLNGVKVSARPAIFSNVSSTLLLTPCGYIRFEVDVLELTRVIQDAAEAGIEFSLDMHTGTITKWLS